MTAQHPHSILARGLAALAVALTLGFGLAGSAATPAIADSSQWVRQQPHWSGQSNGWRRHVQWRNHRHHHRHFNNGFNGCFGDCGPRIVFNGGGVFFASPVFSNSGFFIVNPGFVVQQPAFIVNQPAFIVNQPAFIVGQPTFVVRRPNLVFARPEFAAKQKAFIKRHPSLQLGQPWGHKPWTHKSWSHGQMPMGHSGVRIIRPGMN